MHPLNFAIMSSSSRSLPFNNCIILWTVSWSFLSENENRLVKSTIIYHYLKHFSKFCRRNTYLSRNNVLCNRLIFTRLRLILYSSCECINIFIHYFFYDKEAAILTRKRMIMELKPPEFLNTELNFAKELQSIRYT